ncbi:MAG: hypothetical protein FOGNACKC_03185 [Anaerolineae bacterium]|nr:hypothetical protein [Anaerolineae bacterium]
MPPETVSVIVPVRNGAASLPNCLRALTQQTRPPDEIIVVDDGSGDDSAAVARQFTGVTVLAQPPAGPAAARNRGAASAGSDILLFTDADCIPAPDWVAQMIAPFAGPEVAGARGVYRSRQPQLTARFVQQEYQDRYDRLAGLSRIDFVDTYSAGYRRDLFLAAGGFDARFPSASVEDQELSFRLAAQGCRLVFAPNAVVEHQHNRTLGRYARRKFNIGYWKARLLRRHPAKAGRDSHTPQRLKVQLGLAALAGGLLALGGLGRRPRLIGGGLLAGLALLLTEFPFYLKLFRRDRPVLLIAPVLVVVRAAALALGLALGTLRFWLLTDETDRH